LAGSKPNAELASVYAQGFAAAKQLHGAGNVMGEELPHFAVQLG
jgi:hypothetical protein